ncbi:MAG: 30S ribosomal protein S5 [Nanoarchaeota archaeon]|nr:30S ribosomal protein S5 [Nanoarchaeota archaeon]
MATEKQKKITEPVEEDKETSKAKGTEESDDIAVTQVKETEEVLEGTPKVAEAVARTKTPDVNKDAWRPKTLLGKKVKEGAINDIDAILESGQNILEQEIVDILLPNVESDLLLIGQSKGKFGGGARRVFRQTQKKTKEGNKPSFATYAVIGDRNGHVGIGYGKSRETVPAREKAFRNAKLNLIKVRRGSGSWESNVPEPHSIPFAVRGKCGSVIIRLMPAPKGTGLVCQSEIQKILRLAGIKDVWSKTEGQTRSRINLIKATFEALKQLKEMKIQPRHIEEVKIFE